MTDLKDNEDRYIFAFIAIDQVGATANVNMIASTSIAYTLKSVKRRNEDQL